MSIKRLVIIAIIFIVVVIFSIIASTNYREKVCNKMKSRYREDLLKTRVKDNGKIETIVNKHLVIKLMHNDKESDLKCIKRALNVTLFESILTNLFLPMMYFLAIVVAISSYMGKNMIHFGISIISIPVIKLAFSKISLYFDIGVYGMTSKKFQGILMSQLLLITEYLKGNEEEVWKLINSENNNSLYNEKKGVLEVINDLIEFRDSRGWKKYHNLKNLAESVNIEASEILEIFQWKTTKDELSSEEQTHLKGELADTLIYLFYMCDQLGVDPLEIVEAKLEYNKGRKWDFDHEK